MFVILHGLGMFVADMFKSRRRLEAERPTVSTARILPVPILGGLQHQYVGFSFR
jgi:hypothetical protein